MGDHHIQRYANACCVLRVNVNCNECKMKMTEIINSIVGVYDVNIDADGGIVKISGEVDPNVLLRALGRPTGEHGGLVRARITHPEAINSEKNNNNLAHESPSYVDYGLCNHIDGGTGAALEGGYTYVGGSGSSVYPTVYPSGRQVVAQEHPYGCTNYCCRPLPEGIYVPSYPPGEYDPNENWCSIM